MDGLEAMKTGLSHGRDREHVCVSTSYGATMVQAWALHWSLSLLTKVLPQRPQLRPLRDTPTPDWLCTRCWVWQVSAVRLESTCGAIVCSRLFQQIGNKSDQVLGNMESCLDLLQVTPVPTYLGDPLCVFCRFPVGSGRCVRSSADGVQPNAV